MWAVEDGRIDAVHHPRRQSIRQDRLAGDAHVQRDQVLLVVEAGAHLALRDRVVAAVGHVLFARPEQLDRRAGHLLGDGDRLADIVVVAAPAEAAAEIGLVDLALARRAGRRPPRSRPAPIRRSASGTTPRTCPGVERGGVHRLHRRVALVRIGVDRFDHLGGAGERSLDVAGLVADEGFVGIEAVLEHSAIGGAGDLTFSPSSQTIGSASSAAWRRHQESATTATALSPTSRSS